MYKSKVFITDVEHSQDKMNYWLSSIKDEEITIKDIRVNIIEGSDIVKDKMIVTILYYDYLG